MAMDTNTGEMIQLTEQALKRLTEEKKKNLVVLPDGLAEKLLTMNRKDRRTYYARHRKEFRDKGIPFEAFTKANP